MSEPDELYVLARRVMLDALDALGAHRDAIVVVGAQAVYLRVGEVDLAVAPFTTDADLAIDPAVLAEIPPLEQALTKAGFAPASETSVGMWVSTRRTSSSDATVVEVDLLVPESVSPGAGTRTARLRGHAPKAARRVKGLEGALVDADRMPIAALDSADARSYEARVAGPAALLVSKVNKIAERLLDTNRLRDKDALDVLRLLRGTETDDLASRYRTLLRDARSADAAKSAVVLIESLFGTIDGDGAQMAVRSAGPLADADEIAASCAALARALLAALEK